MGRQIAKGTTFLGVPMVRARNVLKAWRYGGSGNATEICMRKDVGLSAPVVAMLLQEFEDRGLIGIETSEFGDERHGLTEAGEAFVTASGKARTPKAKAKAVLDALLARCVSLNADTSTPYHVHQVWLYGSMTRDVPDVGDIDIVVVKRWSPAYEAITDDRARHDKARRHAAERLPAGTLNGVLLRVAAADILFDRQVMGSPRHPLLSPNSPGDFLRLACPCQLLFDAEAGVIDGPVLDRHPNAGERDPAVRPAPEMPNLLPGNGRILPVSARYAWEIDLHFNKNVDLGIFDRESEDYFEVVRANNNHAGALVVDPGEIDERYAQTVACEALKAVVGIDGRSVTGLVVPAPSRYGESTASSSYVFERRIAEGADGVSYELHLRTLESTGLRRHGHANALMPVLLNAAADIVRIARRDDEAGRARPIIVGITTEGRFSEVYEDLFEDALARPEAWIGKGSTDVIGRLMVRLNGEVVDLIHATAEDSAAVPPSMR